MAATQAMLTGLFIKYVRVGSIRLRVALAGFFVNPKLNLAIMDPFVVHGMNLMPGGWPSFLHALESHAYKSVVMTTASSWAVNLGSRVSRFLLGASKDEYQEGEKEEQKKRFLLGH